MPSTPLTTSHVTKGTNPRNLEVRTRGWICGRPFHRKLLTIIFSYRKLNLARCYTADISSIKNFLEPEICKCVTELDLTSCYWLKSVDIRRCVLKLSNLEALYVADTSLSISDLIKILKALHQVLIVATLFLDIVSLSLRFIACINLGNPALRMPCSCNCRSKNKCNG
jgi:hypothetical protein